MRSGQLKGNLRSRSEARRNHLHPVFGGGGDLIIHCKPPGWGISACVAQLGLFKDHHGDGEFESPSLSFSFPHTPNLHTYTHITYHIVHLPSGSRFFCCSPHLLVKMIDWLPVLCGIVTLFYLLLAKLISYLHDAFPVSGLFFGWSGALLLTIP